MRIRPLLFLMLLAWLTGCGSTPAAEVTLTPADSAFAELLADLHLADAAALVDMETDAFRPDYPRRDSVLAVHGLDSTSFGALSDAYSAEPERLLAIYNRAVDVASGR